MQKSSGSIQEVQGMIADGFSSQQEQYMKKDSQQKVNQPDLEHKIKEQIKTILPPPQEIKSKVYSLVPDKVNGWGLKKQQPNPIPITFSNRYLDNLITLMLTKPNKRYFIVYLGPRYQSTFYAWRDKPFKFPYTHINMPKNIKYKKRPFLGLNPDIDQDSIYFDSMFQSGNLDFAVKVNSHEYDLFLRVDSNTRGHFNWFNFTIKNLKPSEKYKLNICNLQRGFCLYTRGMKPYIKSLRKKNDFWKQAGENVNYFKKEIRFSRDYDVEVRKFFTLSFEIETDELNDEIQISYCVPYTYSEHLKLIEDVKLNSQRKNILKQTSLCMSLGGLPISLLTITEPDKNQAEPSKKKCVIICGRVHPGEANGSYMVEGFIKFICGQSKHAQILRKYLIFKIVPMMNPDGVVLGNYRTGLSGRDFNREYRNPDKDIFPQVYFLKKLVTQTKIAYKGDFFMFLDLHGHSTKKNVFAYGPDFPIVDKYYYESRIFAKILEKQNKLFRYHSCVFKISQCKLATARAILLRKINIPLTYTIEASNGFYHDRELLTSVPFTVNQWIKMGNSIGQAIFEYVESMLLSQKIKKERENSKNQAIKSKNDRNKSKSSSQSPTRKINTSHMMISAQQDAKIKKIYQQILKQQSQGPQQPNSDDNISQGSSDKQDDRDDLSKKQLQNLFISIKNNNKLGKNKNRKGKLNKIDLTLFQNDQQTQDPYIQKQQFPKSFRIKKNIDFDKTLNHNHDLISQVFIGNQNSLVNHRKKQSSMISPIKYSNQKKQLSSKQFLPSALTKIINYKFQQQTKNTQYLETISIFPNFRNKNKSTITITQFGSLSQKNNTHHQQQAYVVSNISTPRSIRIDKARHFQRTLNSFGGNRNASLNRKLQQIGNNRFDNSYTKFTKTNFYNRSESKDNNTSNIIISNSRKDSINININNTVLTISPPNPKKIFDRSALFQ